MAPACSAAGCVLTLRLALLANPESGRGEAREAERAARARRRGAPLRARDRDDAVAWQPERIVVAGGDGSVGCAAEAAAQAGVPLAVIPVGTANDFARALDLPLDPQSACRLAVHGNKTRKLELAWIEERPFVNAANAGLSPVAASKAHGLKCSLGALAYPIGALRTGLTAHRSPAA